VNDADTKPGTLRVCGSCATQARALLAESACASEYVVVEATGERIRCSGTHLRGNIFRSEQNHTAEVAGMLVTWRDREAVPER